MVGLQVVLSRLLELPASLTTPEQRQRWAGILATVPGLAFREMDGHTTISPAHSWERINNEELPQLYPLYPWGIYGLGRPDLDIAINTYRYGADNEDMHGIDGWKQDPIFVARLGLTEEAREMILHKFADSSRRFPTFWGPNFDWTPDFNHAGSAAIALQEMLMQCDGTDHPSAAGLAGTTGTSSSPCTRPTRRSSRVSGATARSRRLVVTPPERAADIVLHPVRQVSAPVGA